MNAAAGIAGIGGSVWLCPRSRALMCVCPPQRNAFANDTIPAESYISAVQAAHLGTLCSQSLPLAASLKHTLLSLVRLTGDLIM